MHKRYLIVAVTAVAALWMYIDRVCFSILAEPMKAELLLPEAPLPPGAEQMNEAEVVEHQKKWADERMEFVLGAFFFTYALFQIPVGAMADRYGPRLVLTVSIVAWSVVTALTGLAWSFAALFAVRLLLGFTESGAYPAAAGLVKRWARPEERGRFSSVVALGGRIGGAVSPKLTASIALLLAGVTVLGLAAGVSGVNWRAVFVLYGACGLVVGAVFWFVVRDTPPDRSSAAPAPQVGSPPVAAARPPLTFVQRVGLLTRCRGMWLFGGLQFCNNISWAFLVTLLPTFLKDADVGIALRGNLQTAVLTAGCVGMLLGGLVTDWARRRFGPRWGRSGPIGATMTTCALMCAVASSSPGLWVTVAALAMMSLCQDLGNPSVWAYAQDVGGRNVGTALGFGNMLGNFGAAISPRLLGEVRRAGGWEAAFVLCALVYLLAAVCGLLLDARRPVDPDDA